MVRSPPLRALLEGLDEGLLRRLLAPYAAFCAQKAAAPVGDVPAWRAALARALRLDDPDMPVALQHALWSIGVLATPEGEAELRALAAEKGARLSAPASKTAAVAVEAYLEHRALFRDARAPRLARNGPRGRLLGPPRPGSPTALAGGARGAATRRR
jgi:hypothetical protein